MFLSVISFPSANCSKEFLKCLWKKFDISFEISNYFSLKMLFIVPLSLQDTFGIIGVPKYSPNKASTCFLISGINSTEVGLPIP
jgi:hypothetical protein